MNCFGQVGIQADNFLAINGALNSGVPVTH